MESASIEKASVDTNINHLKITRDLQKFLEDWDRQYKTAQSKVALFDPSLTSKWTDAQKIYFAKVFYHVRGHFHDFLWYMGNHAPDSEAKKMIMSNIAEEFSYSGYSHEQLYLHFANSLGADVNDEYIHEDHYLPFVREFNKGHLTWLAKHEWPYRVAAFSAYERLDNIDYIKLLELAKSLGVSRKGLVFFNVHTIVEHFETTLDELINIWNNNKRIIEESFNFIFEHQITMWENLSNAIFKYSE